MPHIILGSRGDWYWVDYTVGDDPTMLSAKFNLKLTDGNIEGQIIPKLAKKHDCPIGDVKLYGHINRCVS